MLPTISKDGDLRFSHEEIARQLEKMVSDPHFAHSEILRNFLKFIISETIEGRSNCLKEYTIALNVLKKPKTFRPKENCIVRIHAVRLRKALVDYYNGPGAMDPIRITLPKGNYVPHFTDNMEFVLNSVLSHQPCQQDGHFIDGQCMTTAVIPFHNQDRKQIIKNFSDGLGIQLSSALMKIKSLSVISYNISRRVPEKFTDVKDIGHLFHAQYVFTGDVQSQKNSVRVTVQIIKADTCEQVWSQTFEKKVTETNSFKIQDEIIDQVMKSMQKENKILLEKRKPVSIMAVA
jgi:TolB-like protein